MTGTRRSRRVGMLTLMFILAGAGVALAHTTLRRSDPPHGGRVALPPAHLRLEFSEPVVARTSRVDLVAPDSQRFALHVNRDSVTANVLVAHVPELRTAGTYRVEWRLVGPDGHAVTGTYRFIVDSIRSRVDTVRARVDTVRAPVDTMVPTEPEHEGMQHSARDSLTQRSVRFGASLALITVIGSVAFALFVLPGITPSPQGAPAMVRDAIEGRLRSLGVVGGWSLLALGAVRLVNHGATLSGSIAALSLGDLGDLLTGSTFGRGWLLQVIAAIALLLLLRSGTRTRWRVLAGVAVVLAISAALLGHPGAVPDVPALAVGVNAAHVLSAGGWAGGILVLSVAALPEAIRAPADQRLQLSRNLLRAFSPLALTCAGVLALTGAATAWLQLRDLGLLFDSDYGLALMRKVVIVLFIIALGAYHWRVVQPTLGTGRSVARLRVSIAIDVMIVLIILLLTAILTGTSPPG